MLEGGYHDDRQGGTESMWASCGLPLHRASCGRAESRGKLGTMPLDAQMIVSSQQSRRERVGMSCSSLRSGSASART